MLKKIIEKDYYSFGQHLDDWQGTIRAGYHTLLEAEAVEDIYVQAVIDCVNKYGPYIVIVSGIAIPHSTEEAKGCHGATISFIKVKEPVDFDRQDPGKKARLLFSLVTVDHEQHLHDIQELVDASMSEELVNALLKAHTVEEL